MKEITGPYLDRISKSQGGHIRLYRPGYPRAPKSGYVLRSHIVWEIHHGPLPEGLLIHHRNENPEDDEIENLEALTKADHARLHKPGHGVGWRKRLRAKLIEVGGLKNESRSN